MRTLPPAVYLAAVTAVLAATAAVSLFVGTNALTIDEVWTAIRLGPGAGSEASAVVWDSRVPRTTIAIAAGSAFGVAGALIQAVTRNPLADPGILGVNAGAGLAITLGAGVFGITGIHGYIWMSFLGAVVATVAVAVIGGAGHSGTSPAGLVLAGVALAAVLMAISNLLALIDPDTFRTTRNWGLGSVARAPLGDAAAIGPFLLAGLVLAAVAATALNAVALGDDHATALGANVAWTRAVAIIAVTLLAGAGTAITGGLAFVGLMVPHIVRWLIGPDQRWILAFTVVTAPVLVLLADIAGRVLGRPGEIETGVMTAVFGAPVLIALARRRTASTL